MVERNRAILIDTGYASDTIVLNAVKMIWLFLFTVV